MKAAHKAPIGTGICGKTESFAWATGAARRSGARPAAAGEISSVLFKGRW